MPENIIEFKNISKNFGGIQALRNVSFSISKGEVHTIMGENGAGKSTLMNILSGIYTPCSGQILLKSEPVYISTPLVAKAHGISTVFQELKLCLNLTVVENIFLGREYRKGLGMDWGKMTGEAEDKLKELGMDINVRSMVQDLSAAQMQLVEIAKAMFVNAEILILDEPTSSLTYNETEKLFKLVRKLKNDGVAIIFISHRMEEVFSISDRISIMRNGEYLGTYTKDETTPEKVVSLISNKKENKDMNRCVRRTGPASYENKAILKVKDLSRGKLVRNISFDLHEGEMLGFYGLEGSGRTELMETLYGLYKPESGKMELYGKEISFRNTRDSINAGIAMVPEDRKHVGLFMNFDIKDNILSIHDKDMLIPVLGVVKGEKLRQMGKLAIEELSIKANSPMQMVKTLSGGNQQKVVISKCLSINPSILIMDEPTRGVDVGAKKEIYDLLHSLRNDEKHRKSIIIVSSELEEVVSECDRIIVIKEGRIAGELRRAEINRDSVLQLAFNG